MTKTSSEQSEKDKAKKIRNDEIQACNQLLERLVHYCPSHAPRAAPMQNPAPSVVTKTDASSPVSAAGTEACGVTKALNSVTTLTRAASQHSGFSVADIRSHRHRADLVRTRHIVMYLSYRLTTLSFPMIGRLLDGRDHTTILHGVRKVERQIQDDERLADDVAAVRDLAIDADPALGALA